MIWFTCDYFGFGSEAGNPTVYFSHVHCLLKVKAIHMILRVIRKHIQVNFLLSLLNKKHTLCSSSHISLYNSHQGAHSCFYHKRSKDTPIPTLPFVFPLLSSQMKKNNLFQKGAPGHVISMSFLTSEIFHSNHKGQSTDGGHNAITFQTIYETWGITYNVSIV